MNSNDILRRIAKIYSRMISIQGYLHRELVQGYYSHVTCLGSYLHSWRNKITMLTNLSIPH